MSVSRCVILVVLAAYALVPAWGQSALQGSEALLDALFAESGLEASVGLSSEAVEALIEAEREGMEEEEHERLAGALRYGLARDAMVADARAALGRVIDADTAAATLGWLRSPLGRRIVALETLSAEVDEEVAAAYITSTDFSTPEGRARAEIALALVETIGSEGIIVETLMAMFESMMLAAMQAAGEEDEGELFEALDALELQLTEQAGDLALGLTLYTYREASLEDLEAYLAFLATDVGQWYVYVMAEASVGAYSGVGERIGEALGASVGRQP